MNAMALSGRLLVLSLKWKFGEKKRVTLANVEKDNLHLKKLVVLA